VSGLLRNNCAAFVILMPERCAIRWRAAAKVPVPDERPSEKKSQSLFPRSIA